MSNDGAKSPNSALSNASYTKDFVMVENDDHNNNSLFEDIVDQMSSSDDSFIEVDPGSFMPFAMTPRIPLSARAVIGGDQPTRTRGRSPSPPVASNQDVATNVEHGESTLNPSNDILSVHPSVPSLPIVVEEIIGSNGSAVDDGDGGVDGDDDRSTPTEKPLTTNRSTFSTERSFSTFLSVSHRTDALREAFQSDKLVKKLNSKLSLVQCRLNEAHKRIEAETAANNKLREDLSQLQQKDFFGDDDFNNRDSEIAQLRGLVDSLTAEKDALVKELLHLRDSLVNNPTTTTTAQEQEDHHHQHEQEGNFLEDGARGSSTTSPRNPPLDLRLKLIDLNEKREESQPQRSLTPPQTARRAAAPSCSGDVDHNNILVVADQVEKKSKCPANVDVLECDDNDYVDAQPQQHREESADSMNSSLSHDGSLADILLLPANQDIAVDDDVVQDDADAKTARNSSSTSVVSAPCEEVNDETYDAQVVPHVGGGGGGGGGHPSTPQYNYDSWSPVLTLRLHLFPGEVAALQAGEDQIQREVAASVCELQSFLTDDAANASLPLEVCLETLLRRQVNDVTYGCFTQFMQELHWTLVYDDRCCTRNFLANCSYMCPSSSNPNRVPVLTLTVRELLSSQLSSEELEVVLQVATTVLQDQYDSLYNHLRRSTAANNTQASLSSLTPFSSNLCRALALQGKLVHVLYFVAMIFDFLAH